MTDELQISEREREILRLVATGASNQQIAQQLNISINTVKVHLRNIFGKIGVVSRTEATLYAVRSGLVSVERAGATAVAEEPEEAPPQPAPEPPPAPPAPPAALPAPEVAEPPAPAPEAAAPALRAAPEPLPQAPPLAFERPAPLPAPAAEPQAPAQRLALNPLVIGLAAVALLAVGGLIATLLLRPGAPAAAPTAAAGAPPATTGRWRALADLPEPRAAFALAGISSSGASFLYTIGGDAPTGVSADVLRYDVAGNSWARYSSKPTAVADVQAAVIGGKIYVPGGRTADGAISAGLEVYDPQSDAWSERAPMPAPRSRYALAAVEGKLYLFGGWDGSDYAGQVWQYTPDSDSWADLTAMPAPRADMGAAAIGDQIFLLGGENGEGRLARHERYSPAQEGRGNPWAVRAPLPDPSSQVAAAGAADWLFVLGGDEGAQSYNSARDVWQSVSLPAELAPAGLRAQFLDNSRLFILGGRDEAGLSAAAYEYQALFTTTLPALTGDS